MPNLIIQCLDTHTVFPLMATVYAPTTLIMCPPYLSDHIWPVPKAVQLSRFHCILVYIVTCHSPRGSGGIKVAWGQVEAGAVFPKMLEQTVTLNLNKRVGGDDIHRNEFSFSLVVIRLQRSWNMPLLYNLVKSFFSCNFIDMEGIFYKSVSITTIISKYY